MALVYSEGFDRIDLSAYPKAWGDPKGCGRRSKTMFRDAPYIIYIRPPYETRHSFPLSTDGRPKIYTRVRKLQMSIDS